MNTKLNFFRGLVFLMPATLAFSASVAAASPATSKSKSPKAHPIYYMKSDRIGGPSLEKNKEEARRLAAEWASKPENQQESPAVQEIRRQVREIDSRPTTSSFTSEDKMTPEELARHRDFKSGRIVYRKMRPAPSKYVPAASGKITSRLH
ncbi:hypothetical protein L4G92_06265 [Neisseria sp. ZJ106]|uniref:Uncharacterized protein n=1 Tax=Neisseria lisongii TaxID=2912188 RepID=A0ABY7RIM0_9NEIS|nr:hypothetical protein [Neisseria lisongii]MCF7521650.1 hypothetical protein [Neisseria lisongii]WCL70885.1 hypothetical protein PJU73_05800 [Neisseria lisongii]